MADVVKEAKREWVYIKEKAIWRYTIELCTALAYCHGLGILHRDLKASLKGIPLVGGCSSRQGLVWF